ncbi:MAG TPA: ATP-binding protein [Solirubrobacteraceae bacterium]|nr:ATP-binding protein [Solirubrobacteraceae bacterium]
MSEDHIQRDAQLLPAAVAGIFEAHGLADPRDRAGTVRAARERAALALPGLAGEADAPRLAAAPFAGSMLVDALAARRDASPEALLAVTVELAELGFAPLQLTREALRAPSLAALPPALARATVLRVLLACAPLHHVSVWSRSGVGGVRCSAQAGGARPSAAARRVARAVLAEIPPEPGGEMRAFAIVRAGEPVAALVARAKRGGALRAGAFLAEAEGPLAAIEEREALLAGNAASERMLLQASERRLTRLGYDLHDGPLQDLLLLGEDLALFRRQLAVVLDGRRGEKLLGGRLDDLDARLLALESALRRISTSVHSAVLVTRPFGDALGDLLDAFAARSGIEPELECEGDLESISTSQRLAVLSVVGEALNNVREHGEASAVGVSIKLGRHGLRARVRDDGRGFDVERELLRAARNGHLGLAGMHERVRLLDGHCRVDSAPGGPTEVTLVLPLWEAPAAEGRSDVAGSAG